jgi:hypothetical protein
MVFLTAGATPSITTVEVAEAGARVAVPAWVATTTQLPFFNRLKVEPEIAQIPVDEVEYVTAPPPEGVEVRERFFAEIFAFTGRVKVIVCGSLTTSNEILYKSEARYVAFSFV